MKWEEGGLVFKRELPTHIRVDYAKIEFLFQIKKNVIDNLLNLLIISTPKKLKLSNKE